MNAKQLKKLIAELVRKEITVYKEEIIKEVRSELKAELFDLLISGRTAPVTEAAAPAPAPSTPPEKEIDRSSLRKLFENRLSEISEEPISMANAQSTTPPVKRPATPQELPQSFSGADVSGTKTKPQDMERTMNVINRDYSALMKAMNKK